MPRIPLQPKNEFRKLPETAYRQALLAKGWTPLPVIGKTTPPKGWPKLQVDAAMIREWDRYKADAVPRKATGTTIRLAGQQLVLDVDVWHELASVEIAAMLEAEFPAFMAGCLRRHSGGIKIAFIGQCDARIGARDTKFFNAPGVDEKGQRVEVFGGATNGRHVVVHGLHTPAGPGQAERRYAFVGRDIVEVRPDELPVFPSARIDELLDKIEAILARHLTLVPKSVRGNGEHRQLYDLEPGMVFRLQDGEEIELVALERRAQAAEHRAEEIVGYPNLFDPKSTTSDRCKVMVGRAGLTILDWKDHATHHWASRRPAEQPDIGPALRQLQAAQPKPKARKAAKVQPGAWRQEQQPAPAMPPSPTVVEAAAYLVQAFAWDVDRGVVCRLHEARPQPIALRTFQTTYSRYTVEGPKGPNGGKGEMISATKLWQNANERIDIHGSEFRPDKPFPLFVDEAGRRIKNTYLQPRHEGEGDVTAFVAFIERLVPDDAERAFFLDWLAHKWRKPWVPGCVIIMVADDLEDEGEAPGTGRSTLMTIIGLLLGEANVSEVDFSIIDGTSSQGDFTHWQAERLMVMINESREDPNAGRFGTRRSVYERIKALFDPAKRRRMITRKGRDPVDAIVYLSGLIATNHRDAIQIPRAERRLAVLSNGRRMDHAERQAINAWLERPANIASLAQWLDDRDIAAFDPYGLPPMTEAKEMMRAIAADPYEEWILEARDGMAARVFTEDQLMAELGKLCGDPEIVGTLAFKQQARRVMRRHCRKVTNPDGSRRRMRRGAQRLEVFHFHRGGKIEAEIWRTASNEDLLAESEKAGRRPTAFDPKVIPGGKQEEEKD